MPKIEHKQPKTRIEQYFGAFQQEIEGLCSTDQICNFNELPELESCAEKLDSVAVCRRSFRLRGAMLSEIGVKISTKFVQKKIAET